MDDLNSISAALESADIEENKHSREKFDWNRYRAYNVYEGSDSEDERMVNEAIETRPLGPLLLADLDPMLPADSSVPASKEAGTSKDGQDCLVLGQLGVEGDQFCSWNLVRNYPFSYIGNGNRDKVIENFFIKGKVYDRVWDFYYIYPSTEKVQRPILLVKTRQFERFLKEINASLSINLAIPGGPAQRMFFVDFPNDGNPQPRYLGKSIDQEMAEELKKNAPPSYFTLDNDPKAFKPSDRSFEAFKAKIALMEQDAKNKKFQIKEKQKIDRLAKKKEWNHSVKRIQRYLGLREACQDHQTRVNAKINPNFYRYADNKGSNPALAAGIEEGRLANNPNEPPPFRREDSVVFVSVDLEAYERNANLITEVGISTLDTDDLEGVAPGVGAKTWMSLIRARHFRISEHKSLNNTQFVTGCADKFEFGESEFVKLKDAPGLIASCFRYPFSKPGVTVTGLEPKRNIVLVGHGVNSDINFLRTLGYDVFNLSTLQEVADTATMWQYVTRDNSIRKLANILSGLGITGWHLHNAGNDAAYTLQALLGIAMKHLEERGKVREDKDASKQAKIAEAVKEATETAVENQEGWSSEDQASDGGVPIRPVRPSVPKKNGNGQVRGGSQALAQGFAVRGRGTQGNGGNYVSEW